jgi:hypothetical protein
MASVYRGEQREQAVDQPELLQHEEAGEPERGERDHAHHDGHREQAVARPRRELGHREARPRRDDDGEGDREAGDDQRVAEVARERHQLEDPRVVGPRRRRREPFDADGGRQARLAQ